MSSEGTAEAPRITTADGHVVTIGDRVFNYYDGRWGTICKVDRYPQPDTMKGQTTATPMAEWDNYWFDLACDDGGLDHLDGSRISTYDPHAETRGR